MPERNLGALHIGRSRDLFGECSGWFSAEDRCGRSRINSCGVFSEADAANDNEYTEMWGVG